MSIQVLSQIPIGVFAVIPLLLAVIFYRQVFRIFGIVIVPEDAIGIVNKKFVLFGEHKTLPDGTIVALHGEAGLQSDTLAPGLHFWLWPWQYEVTLQGFITIPSGKIGIVESRDGKPLSGGRVLAKRVECNSYQDPRAFLANGGERGPQITVIPPGTYRINTMLFKIELVDVTEIKDNKVGIVTTKEGQPLSTGEIAGKEIRSHNMFQDAQTFLDNGGYKGLQEQVMLAGRYYINPRFATVESVDMTTVPIAHVGVVIAFVGAVGQDVTGASFKHGNLVKRGEKGVCVEPLDPGKYAINPYTHKVELVSTANIVLNWASGKSESHMLDEKLCTITVRSSDGFTFNLDVSQIINIPREDAPKVIVRFGSVSNLVTQVLEPTIGNYFRNAAQGSDAIDFLKGRQSRQEEAKKSIGAVLVEYNVGAIDTLIGDIVPPPELMKTLTDRKIAEQENVTFATQRQAEETRKNLMQAKAIADTQSQVVAAERKVEIAKFDAESSIRQAEGQAKSKTINAEADAKVKTVNAEADANVLKAVGNAEAVKIEAIGKAEAEVIKLKINSMESGNYAAIEVSKNLSKSTVPIVPSIVAGGGNGSGSIVDVMMATMLARELEKKGDATKAPKTPGSDPVPSTPAR